MLKISTITYCEKSQFYELFVVQLFLSVSYHMNFRISEFNCHQFNSDLPMERELEVNEPVTKYSALINSA